MDIQITPEVARRITQGIAEAQRVIDKEMTYTDKHRNNALIARCQAHIEKMRAAMRRGVLASGCPALSADSP